MPQLIIQEPLRGGDHGVLDKLMRYPISEINGDINTNELAKIMGPIHQRDKHIEYLDLK